MRDTLGCWFITAWIGYVLLACCFVWGCKATFLGTAVLALAGVAPKVPSLAKVYAENLGNALDVL